MDSASISEMQNHVPAPCYQVPNNITCFEFPNRQQPFGAAFLDAWGAPLSALVSVS